MCQRITIPAGLTREMPDRLDEANGTERALYPGLDGLSSAQANTRTSGLSGEGEGG